MQAGGVLFDLDGTLTPRHASVTNFAPMFAEDFAAALGPVDPAVLCRTLVDVDQRGYNKRRSEDLIAQLPWRAAPTPAALSDHWQARFPDAVLPQPGLHDVLDALRGRGLPLGVVTNGGTRSQERKIARLGVREHLQAVVISEAVNCEKPDARIFEIACGHLNVAPEDCWFVGDHPEKDVLAAERFGMRGVWISDSQAGFEWPADAPGPPRRIERLAELLDLMGPA